jgi:type II secretory pathway component GspD/PulD (secretin)
MLGDRLVTFANPSPEVGNYKLRLAGGWELRLSIDRRNHRVLIEGPESSVRSCVRMIQSLDRAPDPSGQRVGLVSLAGAGRSDIARAVDAIRMANSTGAQSTRQRQGAGWGNSLVTTLFAPLESGPEAPPADAPTAGGEPPPPGPEGAAPEGAASPDAAAEAGGLSGLIGPVQIEVLDGLDILVIRGRESDVEQLRDVIEQIEELSGVTQPAVKVQVLQSVDCQALGEIVSQVYGEVYAPRQGTVSITPLVKPNALLFVGRPENVDTARDLARRLDKPVAPNTQFRVFRLEHAPAESVRETINEFYEEREGGLGAQVRVMADYRSNAVIVLGSPSDLKEVGDMIARLDTPTSEAVNEIRLFQLENSLAEDVATVLQQAIQGAAPGAAPGQQAQAGAASQKSVTLRFLKVDAQGQRLLSSGVVTDVQITSDVRSNALLVSAPAVSMPLIEALVRELDQLPAAEAQIKVFEIVNGDAEALVEMLEELFGETTGTDQLAVQTAGAEGESTLVPLRFSLDYRTNSIIASGTAANLTVVEAILLRLDDTEVRNRETKVYRLLNAPADAVAEAVNNYLRSEREVEQIAPGVVSPFEQIEREVVVVPEVVSNTLIVSATPRYFEEIIDLVEQLDKRPPMVMIQVLIAEVSLNNTDEFGVEVGLQDSVLFDRGLLGDISTIVRTETGQSAGGQLLTTETEEIVSATNTPGFNFNNQPLGNAGSTSAFENAAAVGTQGLSHFALGRTNNELQFGGLVLSASSQSVSILLRALQECRRLEVLARPQIMTLDNQPAFIQVGERVPRITNVQVTQTGTQNNTTLDNVGLILGVRPRISPDGLVVMEIDAERSELGPDAEGIPISINLAGDVIRSPRIKTTTAQTTVAAVSGQTIVMGGLISKSTTRVNRRVPVLADIPILGELFRYDFDQGEKDELLIIMTPHVIENEEDAEVLKQEEAARINWCLSDLIEIHGDIGVRSRSGEWTDAETTVIYPDGFDAAEEVRMPANLFEAPEIRPEGSGPPGNIEPLPPSGQTPAPVDNSGMAPSAYQPPVRPQSNGPTPSLAALPRDREASSPADTSGALPPMYQPPVRPRLFGDP